MSTMELSPQSRFLLESGVLNKYMRGCLEWLQEK